MKKTAIAVALAGVVAAPAAFADTTVYGSLRLATTWTDPTSGNQSRNNWDITDHSSRLGFKGTEDLGNGLSAVYRYEFGVNAADGPTIGGARNRLAYVGLKGGWGSLTMGTQWNPYYFAVAGEVDLFAALRMSAGGYYNNDGFTRSNDMLVYTSPAFGGFTFYGAMEMDGAQGSQGVDRWQLAGIYDNGPLFVGAGWRNTNKRVGTNTLTNDTQNQFGLSARYTFGNFLVAGEVNWNKQYSDTTIGWDILGQYRFGRNRVYAAYYDVDSGDSPIANDREKDKGWGIGIRHDLSGRSRVFAELGQSDDNNTDQFSIGMRHDF